MGVLKQVIVHPPSPFKKSMTPFIEKKIEEFVKIIRLHRNAYLSGFPLSKTKDWVRAALHEAYEVGVNSEDIATLAYGNGYKAALKDMREGVPKEVKGNIGGHGKGINETRAQILSLLSELEKQHGKK
jgi:hypothetical protein